MSALAFEFNLEGLSCSLSIGAAPLCPLTARISPKLIDPGAPKLNRAFTLSIAQTYPSAISLVLAVVQIGQTVVPMRF
jgi:hypothetical protein